MLWIWNLPRYLSQGAILLLEKRKLHGSNVIPFHDKHVHSANPHLGVSSAGTRHIWLAIENWLFLYSLKTRSVLTVREIPLVRRNCNFLLVCIGVNGLVEKATWRPGLQHKLPKLHTLISISELPKCLPMLRWVTVKFRSCRSVILAPLGWGSSKTLSSCEMSAPWSPSLRLVTNAPFSPTVFLQYRNQELPWLDLQYYDWILALSIQRSFEGLYQFNSC